MLKETELRIVRALTTTSTPRSVLASEWGVSTRTLARIAKKYGVNKRCADCDGIHPTGHCGQTHEPVVSRTIRTA
jgi:hypothetical protein